jgi:gliding motility-associated-like protein
VKKIFAIFIFLCLSIFSYATHQVAGYIAIKWLTKFEYQITVYDYTNCYPAFPYVADRDTMRIHFGDGTSRLLTRINGQPNCLVPGDPNPTGEPLCNWDYNPDSACPRPLNGARKVNIYQTTYTYPGPGAYHIWIDDQDRMSNINNITYSVGVDYYMYSSLVIPPVDSTYYINSPLVSNPPVCQYGCVGSLCYTYNPGAYIPNLRPGTDDSIGYSLGKCLMLNLSKQTPETATGYYNPGATIDTTGTLRWCNMSPSDTGIWNFAILMTVYEKVPQILAGDTIITMQSMDTVELEVEVVINSICYSPTVTSKDTCVEAGDKVAITYTATVPSNTPLYVSGSGQPFSESPPATLTGYTPPAKTLHPVFNWLTTCNEVRESPYEVVIKATEKIPQGGNPPDTIFYSGYGTSLITVVGPPPQHLMAESEGNTVCLHWRASICSRDTIYNVYRRKGCSDWQHGYCETGVPAYTGYTLIATLHGLNDTTYCDSNLSPGVSYNYIVDGSYPFPDNSQSYASNDTCITIKLGVPIITNVSVTKTDPAKGEMFIRWIKPIADSTDLDTTKYPPPYTYTLERAIGMNTPSFVPIKTIVSPHFNSPISLTYLDAALDTKDSSYSYKVNFYDSGSHFIGSSGSASSIYLRLQREDMSMKLGWSASVPWDNDTFNIYREGTNQVYSLIGKTTQTTYIDTGLHNGSTYCYYVESVSEYTGASRIPHPLYDSSETTCGTPEDTIPPCPPPLNVQAKCLLYEDSLIWHDPDGLCPKANKTVRYQIYFTPVENGDMYVIATINNPEDTIYVNSNLTSVAGCYAVIAIDSAGQTSVLNTECVDNCVDYQLPNVFTPNGDGINDFFTPVEEYRYVKDIDINIYNRWGQIVFHTTNPSINWNGNIDNSGGACPDGTYYYVCVVNEIRVTGIEPITLKGFIQLIRN